MSWPVLSGCEFAAQTRAPGLAILSGPPDSVYSGNRFSRAGCMDRLVVEVGADRNRCGRLSLIDARGRMVCGPFAVAARSSDALAAANGNPRRDPLLRFGDTPTGGYAIRQLAKSGKGTKLPAAQFGPHGIIVIEAISGDAACAEATGRFHFLISGGDLSASGQLRSTAGSLRLSNKDQRKLFAALQKKQNVHCEVVRCDRLPDMGIVFDDPACADDDPPRLPRKDAASHTRASREALRGTAASVMVFGFTVSFVVAQGAAPARASINAPSPSAQAARESGKFIPPATRHDRPYTRLAYDTTGPGYGIPGLPGIYTGGPSDGGNAAPPPDNGGNAAPPPDNSGGATRRLPTMEVRRHLPPTIKIRQHLLPMAAIRRVAPVTEFRACLVSTRTVRVAMIVVVPPRPPITVRRPRHPRPEATRRVRLPTIVRRHLHRPAEATSSNAPPDNSPPPPAPTGGSDNSSNAPPDNSQAPPAPIDGSDITNDAPNSPPPPAPATSSDTSSPPASASPPATGVPLTPFVNPPPQDVGPAQQGTPADGGDTKAIDQLRAIQQSPPGPAARNRASIPAGSASRPSQCRRFPRPPQRPRISRCPASRPPSRRR